MRRAIVDRHVVALLAAALLAWPGCASDRAEAPAPSEPAATVAPPESLPEVACTEPRGEVCTFEYNPVCALRDTGVRCVTQPCPTWEWKTYANACAACADGQVAGYHHGPCAEG